MGPARSEGAREDARVHRFPQVRRTELADRDDAVADRDALVEDDPGTFYLNKHYLNHPCVLVRLPRIRLNALEDLVVGAHRFANAQMRVKADIGNQRGTARPSRDRADRS